MDEIAEQRHEALVADYDSEQIVRSQLLRSQQFAQHEAEQLIAILERETLEPQKRLYAADALLKLDTSYWQPDALREHALAVAPLCGHANLVSRRTGVMLLASLPMTSLIESHAASLVRLLSDADPHVQRTAAGALERCAPYTLAAHAGGPWHGPTAPVPIPIVPIA